eukprot:Colp12_sorted_trinity150504_noHs@17238
MTEPKVVIIGAGVVGASTAYFLTQRGIKPFIVEKTGAACGASGKAGGFLAYDWCDSMGLGPFARKSFELHAELADTLGTDYGYRRVTTSTVNVKAIARKSMKRGATPGYIHPPCMIKMDMLSTPRKAAILG